MNNILNLNQEPKQIAEDAKLYFTFWALNNDIAINDYECNELAINLIENMLSVIPNTILSTWEETQNYAKLSKVLEILNNEIQ